MKKLLTGLLFTMGALSGFAQTATNFNCADCQSVSHDLFSELDAGKVIVLDWVMPCGACSGPSVSAYDVVTGFQTTNPGRVFLYMVDDVANTICSTLNGWAVSAGVPQNAYSIRFSNAAINMLDYGTAGMPKVVIVGGSNHTVFYNANNTVNTAAMQNAINAALLSTSIDEKNNPLSELTVFPNPSDTAAEIAFRLTKKSTVKIELFNLQGKKVQDVNAGELLAGAHKVDVKTIKLSAGMYLVKVSSEGKSRFINLVVSH